jgi:two-component system response regulator PilR (NtrC family)
MANNERGAERPEGAARTETRPAAEVTSGKLLIVEDEEGLREALAAILEGAGHRVETAPDGLAALELLAHDPQFDLVIADLRLPRMDGLELLRQVRHFYPDIDLLAMTAYDSWESAVEAMRLGAYNYLRKPFRDNDEVRQAVANAMRVRRFRAQSAPEAFASSDALIGNALEMVHIKDLLRRIAPLEGTMLLTGESGTGKSLVAKIIHYGSPRSQGPFVTISCGEFAESLLESELFGHVRGSFTGAVADKKGLFEVAEGGTVFLDEVGEMSPQTQVRLLHVLEEREVRPVGATKTVKVDVRLVAATNRDLAADVKDGRFRADLYYRLNVIPVHLPPLRERRDDIPLLAGHFLARAARRMGKEVTGFSSGVIQILMSRNWPGNTRELENAIQRAVVFCRGPIIEVADLDARPVGPAAAGAAAAEQAEAVARVEIPSDGMDLDGQLSGMEERYIRRALELSAGSITRAARLLGTTFRSLRYRIRKLGIGTQERKNSEQDGEG